MNEEKYLMSNSLGLDFNFMLLFKLTVNF